MIAKLQPIKFENDEEIKKFIERARNPGNISPNDLLIATDGNTFYLKDILNFVGTGEKITFLTSNGEKIYSLSEIKTIYKGQGQLPTNLALRTNTILAHKLNEQYTKRKLENLYLRRNVFGFNSALNIVATTALMITGLLFPPILAAAAVAVVASLIVGTIFFYKWLHDAKEVSDVSRTYDRITSLLNQNSQVENIEGIVPVLVPAESVENGGGNKSLTSNTSTDEEFRESGESFVPKSP
jgi:hypothetical protein